MTVDCDCVYAEPRTSRKSKEPNKGLLPIQPMIAEFVELHYGAISRLAQTQEARPDLALVSVVQQ